MVLSGLSSPLDLVFQVSVFTAEATEIIQKVEQNLNGKAAILALTMVVKNKRSERTMKMESYSSGKDKSFIKILYPGKDRGITS
ncbi:MAG: hypothetical protein QM483_01085 [Desulfuromusa sp.]